MPHFSIQLKNWKQILTACVLLAGGYIGYSAMLQSQLRPQLPQLIESRLKTDLESEVATKNLPIGQGDAIPTRLQAENFVKEHASIQRLNVTETKKRGHGSTIVVRIKFRVPEDSSEQVRYYRLKHTWIGGWFVRGPVTERAWQTAWL
jgi:hypothetical protein